MCVFFVFWFFMWLIYPFFYTLWLTSRQYCVKGKVNLTWTNDLMFLFDWYPMSGIEESSWSIWEACQCCQGGTAGYHGSCQIVGHGDQWPHYGAEWFGVCKLFSLSSSWSFLCIIWSLKRTGAEQNSINIAKVVLFAMSVVLTALSCLNKNNSLEVMNSELQSEAFNILHSC